LESEAGGGGGEVMSLEKGLERAFLGRLGKREKSGVFIEEGDILAYESYRIVTQ
jgi:hypothetical protein